MRTSTSTRTASGDHICYISDLSQVSRRTIPTWGITRSLDDVFEEIVRGWTAGGRRPCAGGLSGRLTMFEGSFDYGDARPAPERLRD